MKTVSFLSIALKLTVSFLITVLTVVPVITAISFTGIFGK
jgi:hypothetical protein